MPLVMCEYSHAMGNSCGDLKDYDDLFQANPKFMGGFIWEWADHAFCLKNESGEEYYGYGGDFGDKHNMRNVCMDGLVNPDRVPHSSLYEAKAVFAPVKFKMPDNTKAEFEIFNRNSHTDLSQYKFIAKVEIDGEVFSEKEFEISVLPLQSKTIKLDIDLSKSSGHRYITLIAEMKDDCLWCSAGHEIAKAQFELQCDEVVYEEKTCT